MALDTIDVAVAVLFPIFGSLVSLYFTVSFLKFATPNAWMRFAAWETERKSSVNREPLKSSYFELTRIFCELVRKEEKDLTILEIGCGGGVNLQFFPPNSSLLMLDINPHCEKYLRENLKKHPHLNLREFICGSAENIHQVQSGSVDVVVSSRTLCSLDESKALKEIFRVLKHNGKLVFEEHIISSSRTWRIIQQFLSISKISKTLCFGCRLNKEIISAISQAGFHKVQHKRIDQSFSLAGQLQPYVVGTATKP